MTEKSNSGKKLQGNTIRPYRLITNGFSNITFSFARRMLLELNQNLVKFDCFPRDYLDAFNLPRNRSRDAGFHFHSLQHQDQTIGQELVASFHAYSNYNSVDRTAANFRLIVLVGGLSMSNCCRQNLGLKLRPASPAVDFNFNFIGLSADNNLHFHARLRPGRVSFRNANAVLLRVIPVLSGPGCAKPALPPAPAAPMIRELHLASAAALRRGPEFSCR